MGNEKKRQLIKEYRIVNFRYRNLETKGAGHIMNPCDPLKKLYTDSLRKLVAVITEWEKVDFWSEELQTFDKIFQTK
jgi:hypothetical protein